MTEKEFYNFILEINSLQEQSFCKFSSPVYINHKEKGTMKFRVETRIWDRDPYQLELLGIMLFTGRLPHTFYAETAK
jgi:hypothetical protein